METDTATAAPPHRLAGEPVSRDTVLLLRAASVAALAHAGQMRKYTTIPYINHPIRVAAKAAEVGLSVEAQIAALLHDVIEDTDMEEADLRDPYDFPPRAIDLVMLLTKPGKGPAPPEYYARIREDPEAAALKVLDRLDNLMELHSLLYSPRIWVSGRLPQLRRWADAYVAKSECDVTPLLAVLPPTVAPIVPELYQSLIDALKVTSHGA